MYLGLCLENDSKSAWLCVDFHIHSLLCFTHLLFGFFQHCFNSQLSHSIMELFSWGRSLRSSSPTINLCTITCHMYCSITCHKKWLLLIIFRTVIFLFFSLPSLSSDSHCYFFLNCSHTLCNHSIFLKYLFSGW